MIFGDIFMRFGAIKIGTHLRDKHGNLFSWTPILITFGAIKIGTHFRDKNGNLFL